MVYVIAGVSGVGKTTLGKQLAKKLSLPFYDGDDYHPEQNIQKMRSGVALNDADRLPWLKNLHLHLKEWESNGGAVLACSALKESYRRILAGKEQLSVNWIFIIADFKTLKERLGSRRGHFFNPDLLVSQLKTLEIPDYGIMVHAEWTTGQQIVHIEMALEHK
ncbi:gluconokinase [Pseudopedobacter beijingensis]|uniref:Gluconokinase n=1 Tax=Pseudopedobacter beijingensis TaxID=1207056 RepID=A0ABW4III6_9SPHI